MQQFMASMKISLNKVSTSGDVIYVKFLLYEDLLK